MFIGQIIGDCRVRDQGSCGDSCSQGGRAAGLPLGFVAHCLEVNMIEVSIAPYTSLSKAS